MVRLGGHTVTIVRPAGRDAFSGDWQSGTTDTTVTGCFVQPSRSSEQTDVRDQTTTDLIAYMPAGVDVVATDRVRFNNRVFQVYGDPAHWSDAHGTEHHLEVSLREVTG